MRLALLLSFIALAAGSAQAESFASSAVGASSASVGSLSDSLRNSSASSTGGKQAAAGRYRVTEVAEAGAGRLQIGLQADGGQAGDAQYLTLTLPAQALAARALAAGDFVQATPRPYGTEFAYADTRGAFFLVLDDTWYAELKARPVQP
jgi:hypothetical protein